MRRSLLLVACLVLCGFTVSGPFRVTGPFKLLAGPPGGFPGINEDWEVDATGWTSWNGAACSWQSGVGDYRIDGSGICAYSGSDAGSQPTTGTHWVAAEFATGNNQYRGVSVRLASSEPDAATFNYVARGDNSGKLEIRSCQEGDVCGTLGTPTQITELATAPPADGDVIALVVTGEANAGAGDLELCAWIWDAGNITTEDWEDPTTWGAADVCKYEGAGISVLASYSDCAGTTNCEDVGADGDLDDAPATQTDVGLYSGISTDGSRDFEWLTGGDL